MTDTLLKKIAKTMREDSRVDATAESSAAKLSEHQRKDKRREHNRALWVQHHKTMAESHAAIAASHYEKVEELRGEA